jgi:hypothetical protein
MSEVKKEKNEVTSGESLSQIFQSLKLEHFSVESASTARSCKASEVFQLKEGMTDEEGYLL